MILVVFYHSIVFWTGNWFRGEPQYPSTALRYLAEWLNFFHVYGFVMVSGYIFYYLKYEKERYGRFVSFAANKAKRLLIPYVFVAAVWVIPISLKFEYGTLFAIISKFVLATAPSQLWFLFMLFDVFIIFWLFSGFFFRYNILGLLVVLIFYVTSFSGGHFIPNYFMIWTAFEYISIFWIGFKIRQYGSNLIRKISCLIYVLVDIIIFVVIQYITKQNNIMFKLLNVCLNFLLHTFGAVMVFVILQEIANNVRWRNQYFEFLSKHSMTIYLFHQQVIYFFIYWLNGVINPYLNAFVNFIGAMIISTVISAFLQKFKVTRFLVGEK